MTPITTTTTVTPAVYLYPFNIVSLHQELHDLPPLASRLDVDTDILSQISMDSNDLHKAQYVAEQMHDAVKSSSHCGIATQISPQIAYTAQVRYGAVLGAHVSATYTPGLAGAIPTILDRLEALHDQMKQNEAQSKDDKARIEAHFKHLTDSVQRVKNELLEVKQQVNELKGYHMR